MIRVLLTVMAFAGGVMTGYILAVVAAIWMDHRPESVK
jgi:phage shock protein PspC (stress-responsive transcriptional regulator)